MLTRLVRFINVSIAALVLLIAVAVYWYAMRPLPKTSGQLSAPVNAPATVRRDARGVPHIEASSWQDAIFLQGFATAQDRLWQMDGLRRYGSGELAEVFGPSALAQDQISRSMRIRAIAQAASGRLTADERAVFAEYARGVNYFIDTHRGNYSLEFSLPGHSYDPRPWTITDSIVVGLVMYRQLTDSAGTDLNRAALQAAATDPAKMDILFPALQGGEVAPGSNAWTVSGGHTADGKPMLANDTHLEYGIPPTWHLVHLKAPGLDVSGCALPGVPGVIIGHNGQIAWGVTNLETDVMDLYLEQIDERTGRYAFQGHVEQAQLDTEFIGTRGAKPTKLNVWVTRHGPIVQSENGRSYSMRWTANDGFSFPFWDIDRAQNWSEFRSAVKGFWGPPQNFVYADRSGNIGYQAGGRVPIRRGFDGNMPLDGTSGKFEWDGYIPFEQMPSIFNPASGIIATSNQNPFPPNYAYPVSGEFADPYRVNQVRALLSAKAKLDPPDMLAVQKDVYSAYDRFLAQQVIAAAGKRKNNQAAVRGSVELLRKWNGQMEKDQAAPMITELLNDQLGLALVRSITRTQGSHGKGQFVPPMLPRPLVIQTLLTQRPSGWAPGNDWDSWIVKNLQTALEEGRKLQGSPVSKWRWGGLLQWKFAHPVGKQFPMVNGYFDIGPVEMSGSRTTVKQTTRTLGPSERMVVDLGDLDRSVLNLTTGESGFVASGHYKDQWPAYYVGKSFPMQFGHVDAKEILRVQPETESK
ncbi:MAG: penicillin acylase family protein [Acidobacteriota bacterium]|nr:penicillin acylase family protein [Acidobacteriota bacterium]